MSPAFGGIESSLSPRNLSAATCRPTTLSKSPTLPFRTRFGNQKGPSYGFLLSQELQNQFAVIPDLIRNPEKFAFMDSCFRRNDNTLALSCRT
jgi:hypothetical protein